MKIGIGLPFALPTDSWPYIKSLALRADKSGFSSFGVTDRLAYDSYEALSTLTAVAAITERIGLVTGILMAPLRNAGVLAKQAATIDAISSGRLTLGLAVGGREDDYLVAPVDFSTRGRRFNDQLDQMFKIWNGEIIFGAQRPVGPVPFRRGGPEILIGGTHPTAIDRVGRFANGYVMGGRATEAEWVGEIMSQVNEAWERHGREGKPRFVATLPCGFGPGGEAAVRDALSDYYGGRPNQAATRQARPNPSSVQEIEEIVAMHEELGTDEIIFRPVIAEIDQMDHLERGIE